MSDDSEKSKDKDQGQSKAGIASGKESSASDTVSDPSSNHMPDHPPAAKKPDDSKRAADSPSDSVTDKRHDAGADGQLPADKKQDDGGGDAQLPINDEAHDKSILKETRLAREREERKLRRQLQKERKVLAQRLTVSSNIKREMFYALENAQLADQPFKALGYFLFFLIIANAVAVFISVEPGEYSWEYIAVNIFYAFSTVCFFLEYVTRIWIADLAYDDLSPSKARLKYIFSVWGAIDFFSFAPSVVFWFFPQLDWMRSIINVVRLLRLIKMTRYMRGLRTIGQVLVKRRSEIVASFFAIAFLVFISCIAMYEIEHPAQPEKFNNLLSGLYWAVTTITGTGYGDLVPITTLGRMVGSVIMFLSVALVAIPGGIFSAGFVAEYQHADRPRIKRKQEEEAESVNPNEGEGHSRL